MFVDSLKLEVMVGMLIQVVIDVQTKNLLARVTNVVLVVLISMVNL